MIALGCLGALLPGCAQFGSWVSERADNAAYEIVRQKHLEAFDKITTFSIAQKTEPAAQRLRAQATRMDVALINSYTTPSCLLSLADALAISIAHSRDYQSRKEGLYQKALALSETRRDFGYVFSPDLQASINYERNDPLLAAPGLGNKSIGTEGYIFSPSIRKVFETGLVLSVNYTHALSRFIESPSLPNSNNQLSVEASQPLFELINPLVTYEPLRQAERSMIYDTLGFKRYQRSFVIGIASQYYGLLGALDNLHNQESNYRSTVYNRERAEMLASVGNMAEFEVDQAHQSELVAAEGYSDGQAAYLDQLDQFKIALGLGVKDLDLHFGPDPAELTSVSLSAMVPPEIGVKEAIEIALANRYDMRVAQGAVQDGERAVAIAMRAFLPNLTARYKWTETGKGVGDTGRISSKEDSQRWGLDFGIWTDWTHKRNAYQNSVIALEQTRRAVEQLREQIVLEVRAAWRQLERLRRQDQINKESLRLSERRVESTGLSLDMGKVKARDLLDAQNALLSSRNAVTAAQVDYLIKNLNFWNALERLEIDEKGSWNVRKNAQ